MNFLLIRQHLNNKFKKNFHFILLFSVCFVAHTHTHTYRVIMKYYILMVIGISLLSIGNSANAWGGIYNNRFSPEMLQNMGYGAPHRIYQEVGHFRINWNLLDWWKIYFSGSNMPRSKKKLIWGLRIFATFCFWISYWKTIQMCAVCRSVWTVFIHCSFPHTRICDEVLAKPIIASPLTFYSRFNVGHNNLLRLWSITQHNRNKSFAQFYVSFFGMRFIN